MSSEAANNDPPPQGGENIAKMREGKAKVGSDSDEETTTSSAKQMNEEENINDRLAVLRREKRLAMNRESARLRRRRKKDLINSLEAQVDELVNHKSRLEASNELLARRVQTLETELASAQSTITALLGQAAPPLGNHSAFAQPSLATNDLISREGALLSFLGRPAAPMSPQSGPRSLESLVGGRTNLGLESLLQRHALESMAGRLGSGAGGVPPGRYVQHSTISSNTLPNRDLGQGDARIDDSTQALLLDALSAQGGGLGRGSVQSIQELLKQQQQQQQQQQKYKK